MTEPAVVAAALLAAPAGVGVTIDAPSQTITTLRDGSGATKACSGPCSFRGQAGNWTIEVAETSGAPGRRRVALIDADTTFTVIPGSHGRINAYEATFFIGSTAFVAGAIGFGLDYPLVNFSGDVDDGRISPVWPILAGTGAIILTVGLVGWMSNRTTIAYASPSKAASLPLFTF
jgi:hypothetical protein